MRYNLIVLSTLSVLCFNSTALANNNHSPAYIYGSHRGIYFEANFGYGKVHQTLSNNLYTSNKGFSWNLVAGFQFTENFAFEGGYVSFPKVSGDLGYQAEAWYMAFKGIYPVTANFNIFGKLGFAGSSRSNPLLLVGGAGLAYKINPQVAITAQLLNIFGSTELPNTLIGTAGISYKLAL